MPLKMLWIAQGVFSSQMLMLGLAHRRVAEEPLIRTILKTSPSFTRAHAITLLKRWFCISLSNNIAVEGITRRHFEGVVVDVQTEEMNESEAETWADDDAVVKWIIQFTGQGTSSDIFKREVDVSHSILVPDSFAPHKLLCMTCFSDCAFALMQFVSSYWLASTADSADHMAVF